MTVALASILRNRSPDDSFRVYVLESGISDENKKKINELKQICDFSITFVEPKINPSIIEKLPLRKNDRLSIAAYYRVFIPELINEEKVIYLDCDIVVLSSLSELYNIDCGDYYLLGVRDIDSKEHAERLSIRNYINSGVLVFNCKKIREDNASEYLSDWISKNIESVRFHDQDILSGAFSEKILYIPDKWNVQLSRSGQIKTRRFMRLKDKRILHYISKDKPWLPEYYANPYVGEYFVNLRCTPFREFENEYEKKVAKIRFKDRLLSILLAIISPFFSKKRSRYGVYNEYRVLFFSFKRPRKWYFQWKRT